MINFDICDNRCLMIVRIVRLIVAKNRFNFFCCNFVQEKQILLMARLYLSPHHVLRLKQIQSLSQNAIKRTILPVRGAHLGNTLTLMAMGRNPDIIRVKTLIVSYEILRNA